MLDASECPPTFRTDPQMVQGVIAGGEAAMFRAQEGAEDRAEDGAHIMDEKGVGERDTVMGIAAGGLLPSSMAHSIEPASAWQQDRFFLSCVQPVAGEAIVDVTIRPLVGPEVVTGSTRLKAGTATKLVLNTITTLAMVRLGKVYENLMVDLRATNQKLWDRGARIVSTLTGVDREKAMALLRNADGHVKSAVVMHVRKVDLPVARRMLEGCGGRLRDALAK